MRSKDVHWDHVGDAQFSQWIFHPQNFSRMLEILCVRVTDFFAFFFHVGNLTESGKSGRDIYSYWPLVQY